MSPFGQNGKVWMNGKLIPWNEANIHIASHVIHYGTSLFEGFRAYDTAKGSAILQLHAHTNRLYDSCKMYRMDIPYTQDEFNSAVIQTVKANSLPSCYIRPIVYRGYGTSLFEGFRAYDTAKGSAILQLHAHTNRLYDSCKMYRMDIPYTQDEFNSAVIQTVKANNLPSCYIRPIVYRGYGTLGVDPFPCPVDCAILVWEWGQYLGDEALEKGVDVRISSWQRMAPNTFPALAKSGANYMNSQLIKMEALIEGYVEGIALNVRGHVSEGSGENVFLVINDTVHTPPLSSSILPGITRATVIQLLKDLEIPVVEDTIPREMLYIAEEVFFTGSAAEITPIRSIDKITIGSGTKGPITKKVQEEFFAYINGEREDKYNWLTYVN